MFFEYVNIVKGLGVYFQNDFNFRFQINEIVLKANRMLGFIRRHTKDFKDISVLAILYCSLVLSHLEYCSSIWSPSQTYLIENLERVQKRAVKWLAFKTLKNYQNIDCHSLKNFLFDTSHHSVQTI